MNRMAPGCERDRASDGEPGTFTVRYEGKYYEETISGLTFRDATELSRLLTTNQRRNIEIINENT